MRGGIIVKSLVKTCVLTTNLGSWQYRQPSCGILVVTLVLIGGSDKALAIDCQQQDTSDNYTCSGSNAQGVSLGAHIPSSTAATITVNDLTNDVAPTGTTSSGGGNGFLWMPEEQKTQLLLLDELHNIIIDANMYGSLTGKQGVLIKSTSDNPFQGGATAILEMPVIVSGTGAAAVEVTGTGSNDRTVGSVNVYGPGKISATGASSPGVLVDVAGGKGNNGSNGDGGNAQGGGTTGTVTLSHNQSSSSGSTWDISTAGASSAGVALSSAGGTGGEGGSNIIGTGGNGGFGGAGGRVVVGDPTSAAAAQFDVSTSGSQSPAIAVLSVSGHAGNANHSDSGDGGKGGTGAQGGEISILLGQSTLTTTKNESVALLAISTGGSGGDGGTAGAGWTGGDGGVGQGGGDIDISFTGTNSINTTGSDSDGIAAYSVGGQGGKAGGGSWWGPNGNGGSTGDSGAISIDTSAASGTSISTSGAGSSGIVAQSIAGHGGAGADSSGLIEFQAAGGSAGAGGQVTVHNSVDIKTLDNESEGISALSIGGGGGHGGSEFGVFYANGGSGGQGGDGGVVNVVNNARLTTSGNGSRGIFAQSIGGAGGSGGSSAGLVGIGGRGASTSAGNTVTVSNIGDISTGVGPNPGDADANETCVTGCSSAIMAQSIGGGGGAGGSSGGWFTFGGSAGGGGTGGTVTVENIGGSLSTTQILSPGIVAQSIGGGGGHGGGVVGVGAVLSAAIGSTGGDGGTGGIVNVDFLDGSSLTTADDNSQGILAQSIGGGGGAGGYAVDVAIGTPTPAVSLAVGGSGGTGGAAQKVQVNTVDTHYSGSTPNSISTTGDNSTGIVAQSIGGGGGHGGMAIAVGVSDVNAVSIGIGGTGGNGGDGESSTVISDAAITTTGDHSDGILAQSIGGGGGSGGSTLSIAVSTATAFGIGVGGDGGTAGRGRPVRVTTSGDQAISTAGDFSYGILAQAIGGGGGKGGTAITGSIAISGFIEYEDSAALSFAYGGSGGAGGAVDSAAVQLGSDVYTSGDYSGAVVVQSISGGGGAGGTAIAASVSNQNSTDFALAIGGDGGSSLSADFVRLNGTANVGTTGDYSPGLVAQSVGGGGGSGGLAVAGTLSLSGSKAFSLSLGGTGGSGGDGLGSQITTNGSISTTGQMSDAVMSQSIGGGGGNGGIAVSGNVTTASKSSSSASIGIAVGGDGEGGGVGGEIKVIISGDIEATGEGSRGILAQSIGGGGGTGGLSVAANLSNSSNTKELSVSVAGGGGSGETGGIVGVEHNGNITTGSSVDTSTTMTGAHAILAQSIGGGGGTGGLAATGGTNTGNRSLQVSVGGSGGSGATAGPTTVTQGTGTLKTYAPQSHGILAQSIGGGGGNGGATATFDYTTNAANGVAVNVGLDAGKGGGADLVRLTNSASVETLGSGSQGLVAQSIGGGGGNGGSNSFYSQKGNSTAGSLVVGIGGAAGSGATSGEINLGNSGAITTGVSGNNGDDNVANINPGHAILAQSIAGGGGNGGVGIDGSVTTSKGAQVAVGGKGGGGADAANVGVKNGATAAIQTYNDGSHGIFAQSIAGSGGNGATGLNGNVTNSGSTSLTVGVGGTGGNAGTGGTVTIQNDASVTTNGDSSRGIVAMSIGGGGGSGGIGINGGLSGTNQDSKSTQLEVGVGGASSAAGVGGTVNVTNSGTIKTGVSTNGGAAVSNQMDGIFAQSIGGGGGSGGAGINGNVTNSSQSQALTVGIGRNGGKGSKGGLVTVTNTGAITATGDQSRGIFAQSIGGGGGSGGIGVAGNVSNSNDATSVTQLEVGVGGSGDAGGNGGEVNLTNSAEYIETKAVEQRDSQLHGIFLQSIGGGGGNGGIGIDGNVTSSSKSKALAVGVGGSGSGGGDGGLVMATSTAGAIYVQGDSSRGLFAQSIGGGGGNGAAGLNGTVTTGSSSGGVAGSSGTTLSLAVGGSGGAGGSGGNVTITSSTNINTGANTQGGSPDISQAHAVFAQSVGGGGGTGELTGSLVYAGSSSSKGLAMTIGGTAGGGTGGKVDIQNTGDLTTVDFSSFGLFAQSVGGGGGTAGDLGGMGASDSWAAAISVGGSGGGAGNGGIVEIDNGATGTSGGNVVTQGDGSHALFAQSIGGGGGNGGEAAGLSNTGKTNSSTGNAKLALNLGGSNTTSGNGGAVTVNQDSGTLQTQGIAAHGIIAQSIGAGGGTAGTGAVALSGTVALGGTGSTSGNGGGVTVDASGGMIATGLGMTSAGSVTSSFGILAQSVGGGGGIVGNINIGAEENFGSGLDFNAADTDTTGNGGDVIVSVSAPVETYGASSFGVFAQSVGGGGGIMGDVGPTTAAARIGAGGGVGNAGDVRVTVGSGITTTGENAHAIFAQSAAGKAGTNSVGAPGNMAVTLNSGAKVEALGAGSHGIFAQVSGAAINSTANFAVLVREGASVTGGTASTESGKSDGAAIYMAGTTGGEDYISNSGTITGQPLAIFGAMKTVDNYGTITGDVIITEMMHAFSNEEGGTFNIGETASLGAVGTTQTDSQLTNAGTLAPGGSGSYLTSTLSNPGNTAGDQANLSQTSTGTLAIDVLSFQYNGQSGKNDRLNLDGAADLAGEVAVTMDVGSDPGIGLANATILSAQAGTSSATQSNLRVASSVAANYFLNYPNSTDIVLTYEIDFASQAALDATRGSQAPLSRHLQDMFVAGTLDRDTANKLIAIETSEEYRAATDSLSAEVYSDNQIVSLLSNVRFGDALMSCAERSGDYRFIAEGQCGWLRIGGSNFNQQDTSQSMGFDQSSWGIQGGVQYDVGDVWHIGGGFSYEKSNLDNGSVFSSDGEQFLLGVLAKRQVGPALLAASLSGGRGSYDTTRNINFGSTAKGNQDIWNVSAQVRGEYLFQKGNLFVKPRLDLGVDYVDTSDVNETGAGGLNHNVSGESDTYFNVQAAVEVGGEWTLKNETVIRPSLTLGVTQFFGNGSPNAASLFDNSPQGASYFDATAQFDETYWEIGAGLDVISTENLVVNLGTFGSFSEHSQSYGGSLKIEILF